MQKDDSRSKNDLKPPPLRWVEEKENLKEVEVSLTKKLRPAGLPNN
jgi:hypothetical protein